jgi:hypothetical protein
MNSSVIEARDFGASTATMAPSRFLGPVDPVITSSSSKAVPVDWARAWLPRSRPVANAVVAQSARLNLIFMDYPSRSTRPQGATMWTSPDVGTPIAWKNRS